MTCPTCGAPCTRESVPVLLNVPSACDPMIPAETTVLAWCCPECDWSKEIEE